MGSIPWEARRSAHLQELGMELKVLRRAWRQHVAAGDAALARYEATLNRVTEILTTPPPDRPATLGKVITLPRAA